MKRQKIKDNDLDYISGGAFNFYQKDGKNLVYIDGIGTYYCDATAADWITSNIIKNKNIQSLLDQAIEKKLFWK